MSRRMACAGSVMASLREFEEKPGAPRAGDGRGQRPVREHHIDPGQREALEPSMGKVRLEAIALAEGVEEVRQGNARGHPLTYYLDAFRQGYGFEPHFAHAW